MQQGFLYLVAIIDWATRRVLSWWLSNTLAAWFSSRGGQPPYKTSQ
jgi:putative transposase